MSFVEITGDGYTKDLLRRLNGELPELTWLRQFRDLLAPHLKPGDSVLDFGCATGYACNSLKDFGIKYVGVDFEERYLEIGRKWFDGNRDVRFIAHDIACQPLSEQADAVICSATIEHAPSLQPSLRHMASAARRIFLLRTFLRDCGEIYRVPSSVGQFSGTHFKQVNCYSFAEVMRCLDDMGFDVVVLRDEYTDSMPRLVNGAVRTFYVVRAIRKPKQ